MSFLSTYKTLGFRLGIVGLLYSLCRLLFYLINYKILNDVEVLQAFIVGLRFDLIAILYSNFPFILVSLLPFAFINQSLFQRILRIWFLVTNALFLLTNVVDLQYYEFTGKRIDASVFQISGDILNQAPQLLLHYWFLIFLWIGMIWFIWCIYPAAIKTKIKMSWPRASVVWFISMLLILIGLRGGVQLKPLTPINAFQFTNSNPGANLILNSSFTLIHTAYKKPLERKNWYSKNELEQILPQNPISDKQNINLRNKNVVILILESFSAEYVGHLNNGVGFTPFLDSLASQGISFKNHFANGRTSIQSVVSILAGIPCLLEGSTFNSIYQTNEFYSLFRDIKKVGYSVNFFHGGKNGTMSFDLFAHQLGLDYYGMNEYPHKEDFDGNWGIYDEPYLQYFAHMLSDIKESFVSVVFTLSSHQPYNLPEKYIKEFEEIQKPIHRTIRYTDHALKEFFNASQGQSWYENTLFIITADHTHLVYEKAYQNFLGHYRIPLVIFHPNESFNLSSEVLTQQVDIPISIGDYLGLDLSSFPRFGRSIFSIDTSLVENYNFAMLYENNSHYLVGMDSYLKMGKDEKTHFYNWEDQLIDLNERDLSQQFNLLKSFIQYFNNSMIDNSFYAK